MMSNYSGSSVFITGADGFIGSHLTSDLLQAGAKVTTLVHYNSWNSIGWLACLSRQMLDAIQVVVGDVRDYETMEKYVASSDYVFHLASLIGIPYSYVAPSSYVNTNITGALNIAQACRKSKKLIRLVHTSTSEVYGSAQILPIPESHPLVGQSPYSATKIAADKIMESYYLSFQLPVVTARPFNTFGPRQTARAVIPTVVSQLLSGVSELRLGALSPSRDFNFVTDTTAGLLALGACKSAEGRVVNIGSGIDWSIGETVELLMELTNRHVPLVCDEMRIRPQASEVNRLLADNTLLRELTGWQPQVNFREGLLHTINWIENNLHHFTTTKYNV